MHDFLVRWNYLPVVQSQWTTHTQAQKRHSEETEDSVASAAQSLAFPQAISESKARRNSTVDLCMDGTNATTPPTW